MSAEEVGIDDQLERFNNDLVVNNVPVIIFIAVVCTIGIAGNSVAFAFYRTRMSRSVNTLFLTVLSLNDLLTSFILLDSILDIVYSVNFTSKIGCKILTSINRIFITSSFLLIFLIAVDRFLTIFIMMPRIAFSVRSSKIAIIAMYVFNILTTVPEFIITEPVETMVNAAGDGNETIAGSNCRSGGSNNKQMQNIMKGWRLAESAIVLTCLVTIALIYILIAIKVACVRNKLHEHKGKHQQVVNTEEYIHDNHVHASSMDSDRHVGEEVGQNFDKDTTDETEINGDECTTEETGAITNKTDGDKETHISGEATVEIIELETVNTIQNVSCTETLRESASNDKQAEMPKTKYLKKRKTKTNRNRNTEKRITLMMFVMTLASVLSFGPYYAISLGNRENQFEFNIWKRIFIRSFLFNSSINPFVIGYFNQELRKYFKSVVLRIKPC
ncbi:uncharacterized protein LOC128233911 [Mya arenaria]|uniref:uncharacterized protein LOC128233911 n=1 Tax=Mya arenaria TaxID=6604 RepID=UPI0022E5843B|nr:uncharacterized protein LOC128233911 [Mya arenaria]